MIYLLLLHRSSQMDLFNEIEASVDRVLRVLKGALCVTGSVHVGRDLGPLLEDQGKRYALLFGNGSEVRYDPENHVLTNMPLLMN